MTDFIPSPSDELASAYLDNEATAAERATVEASPELMARVEQLRAAADAIGQPVSPPNPEIRKAHIAAALGAATYASPKVTSLEARQKRRFGAPAALGAAAVVLVALALLVSSTLGGNGDDESDVASAAGTFDDPEISMSEDLTSVGDTGGDDGDSSDDGAMAAEAAPEQGASSNEPDPEFADAESAEDDSAMSEDSAMSDDGAMEEEPAIAPESPNLPQATPTPGSPLSAVSANSFKTFALPAVETLSEFEDQLSELVQLARSRADEADLDDTVQCLTNATELAGDDGFWPVVLLTELAGENVEVFVTDPPQQYVILSLPDCAVTAEGEIP